MTSSCKQIVFFLISKYPKRAMIAILQTTFQCYQQSHDIITFFLWVSKCKRRAQNLDFMVLFLLHQQRVEDPVLWHTNQTLVCNQFHAPLQLQPAISSRFFFSLQFSLSNFPLSFSFLYSSSCSLTARAVLPGSWVEESKYVCKSSYLLCDLRSWLFWWHEKPIITSE